jgi:hypothetical protein
MGSISRNVDSLQFIKLTLFSIQVLCGIQLACTWSNLGIMDKCSIVLSKSTLKVLLLLVKRTIFPHSFLA